jgi:hypothetical protein
VAGLLGGVEQVALAGGALVRLGPRLHLVVGVPATDAEADLRQAVQTAVSFTRDEHRPAYRDAVQGMCQAIDALDAALAQARNVTQAYNRPPRRSPCAEADRCRRSTPCCRTSTDSSPGATIIDAAYRPDPAPGLLAIPALGRVFASSPH